MTENAANVSGYDAEFAYRLKAHAMHTKVVNQNTVHYVTGGNELAAVRILKEDGSSKVVETGVLDGMENTYRYNNKGQRHGVTLEKKSVWVGPVELSEHVPSFYINGENVRETDYRLYKLNKTWVGQAIGVLFGKNLPDITSRTQQKSAYAAPSVQKSQLQ